MQANLTRRPMRMEMNTNTDIAWIKQKVRSSILLKLRTQKKEDRQRRSETIKKELFRTHIFKRAKTVMFYISLDGEVDTAGMIRQAQMLGKIIAVPVCKENRVCIIRPCLFDSHAHLQRGPYGVYEPTQKRFVRLDELDLVVVPGVAFDRKGNRLGRGKGYYDRLLKRLSPKTYSIGIAFDFQILPSIPSTDNDISVKRIIFN